MAKDALIIAALCACLAVACGARTLLAAAPAPAAGGGPVYAACGPTSLAGESRPRRQADDNIADDWLPAPRSCACL